ncbi:MAG TPA: DUF1345 domain-containing protein [Vicinamibacterales bacterium]
MPTSSVAIHRQPRWRRRWRHRPRFLIAVLIFAVVLAATLAARVVPVRAVLIAFDLAATVFLVSVAWMFEHTGPELMRRRARDEDGGHRGFLWSNVATSIVVLVALGLELHARGAGSLWQIVLAAGSLLLSWLFMNTMFALHYAHRFYAPHDRGTLRLQFPGTSEPDYWDFIYFAFTIGMTFQVSDVQIADRRLRRLALIHGIIAFFFNVIIIALTVNVVAGQA